MSIMQHSNFELDYKDLILHWFGKYNIESRIYPMIYKTLKTNESYEEEALAPGFGLAQQVDFGQAYTNDSRGQGWVYRYVPKKYMNGFIITDEALRSPRETLKIQPNSQELRKKMELSREILAEELFDQATDTGVLYGDGKPMCANDRPLHSGGTWSNLATYAPLSEASLEQGIIDVKTLVDDRGLQIALQAQKVVVGNANSIAVHRILDNPDRPGTPDRDINVINRKGLLPGGAIVLPHMQNDSDYFLITNAEHGFKMYEMYDIELAEDNGFDNDVRKVKAKMCQAFGLTDPRCVYGYINNL